jgi:hypothetical protein
MGMASGEATQAETPQNTQWFGLQKWGIAPSRPWGGVRQGLLLRTAHLRLQAGDQFSVGRLEQVHVCCQLGASIRQVVYKWVPRV